ncbi:RebB family R body protein [Kordia sp.]|uniref:RebB family R body protein n=1 Tax=Kordia sp. TaxID=1965332 RepID=UPI003D2B77CE
MSKKKTVNSQITDAVTQANTKVLGESPAESLGNLAIATSQALQNAAHNATTGEIPSEATAQAATVQAITTLYDVDTASAGIATEEIFAKKKK